ncbi:MAG: Hsp20 family protein [Thiobacillus sp.]|nr:Hsp20 family protein [Thiobacillus sp.]
MADIKRYDRFSLARFEPFGDFDDLMKGFFVRPVLFENPPQMRIRMDRKEDAKAYTVHADIPGVKKEGIPVNIEGKQVSISTETKLEKEEKVLRSERYVGKVARSLTLPHEVDEAKSQAKYSDGVLELTLPKKAPNTARKLKVQQVIKTQAIAVRRGRQRIVLPARSVIDLRRALTEVA